jgi:hypothetical protein
VAFLAKVSKMREVGLFHFISMYLFTYQFSTNENKSVIWAVGYCVNNRYCTPTTYFLKLFVYKFYLRCAASSDQMDDSYSLEELDKKKSLLGR